MKWQPRLTMRSETLIRTPASSSISPLHHHGDSSPELIGSGMSERNHGNNSNYDYGDNHYSNSNRNGPHQKDKVPFAEETTSLAKLFRDRDGFQRNMMDESSSSRGTASSAGYCGCVVLRRSPSDSSEESSCCVHYPSAECESFCNLLPTPSQTSPSGFSYKGIPTATLEVTKRGLSRGNSSLIHRKAWLEVSDKYHRYGKNLRLYYRHWESLGCPTNMFFDWLDSKGEAAGRPLPNLEDCPRSELDSDTVLYITDEKVTDQYALQLVSDQEGRCRVYDVDNNPIPTGLEGWIFVLRDGRFYGAQKVTSSSLSSQQQQQQQQQQRFHHSSFFGGKAVTAAGIFITDSKGYLTFLYPHSGHYRPGEADMQRILFYLHQQGVDLRTFQVDTQQLIHVSRQKSLTASDAGKKKKTDSLYLKPALDVAHYLSHKARFIAEGISHQIHRIKTLP